MNIYLTWTPHELSNTENIFIFDLEISQEENCFARARLVVDVLALLPASGTEAVIHGEDKEIFFTGSLVGAPVKVEGDLAKIELLAKPMDFLDKIAALQKESRVPPYWDDLWIRPEKHNDFQEIQDARTTSLYCDPRTGELSQSEWFEGKKTLSVEQNFFPDSLQVKRVGIPLQSCTIHVHAHWIQSESGISSLSSPIRRAFPHFKVSTYTKKSIFKKWPEQGKRLGRSGLWIVKSELKPMVPPSALYPLYSPPIPLAEDGDPLKPYHVKRYWFKPTLWVGWQIQQKRKETLSITLLHNTQPFFPGKEEHKTIEFTLQNINPDPKAYVWRPDAFYGEGANVSYKNGIYKCKVSHRSRLSFEEDQDFWNFKKAFHTPLGDPARSSFFLTDRGYIAAEHAMERAKVVLAKSARCLEVSFEGPWEALKKVTTDTSVTLSDPRLPGGKVHGKVVKYALVALSETGERFVRVTLLCALGLGKVEMPDLKSTPAYTSEGYCEDIYQVHENALRHTPSGLRYFRYDDQGPSDRFKSGHLLRRVELINGPDAQETEMRGYAYTSPSALKKALSKKPTRLRLYFNDLRTREREEHVISVRMAAPWSV